MSFINTSLQHFTHASFHLKLTSCPQITPFLFLSSTESQHWLLGGERGGTMDLK